MYNAVADSFSVSGGNYKIAHWTISGWTSPETEPALQQGDVDTQFPLVVTQNIEILKVIVKAEVSEVSSVIPLSVTESSLRIEPTIGNFLSLGHAHVSIRQKRVGDGTVKLEDNDIQIYDYPWGLPVNAGDRIRASMGYANNQLNETAGHTCRAWLHYRVV